MKTHDVLVARIYVMEASGLMSKIISYLQKEAHIRGVTVFRGITGVGDSGTHSAGIMDLSLNLPLAIEFFDEKSKIEIAINHLATMMKPDHIVFWEAKRMEN